MNKIYIVLMFLICLFVALSVTASTDYESNKHTGFDVVCKDCHGVKLPTTAPANNSDTCISCHGTLKDLSQITTDVKPNPHDTHIGKMDCYECHNTHKPSVNMCSSCHTIDFKVP